jgi:hypothetical protein
VRLDSPDVTFLIDECVGTSVADGLQACGSKIVMLVKKVERGTLDVAWVPRVRDWGCHAIITHDVAMRSRPAEAEALRESGVHVFVLRAHGAKLIDLRAIVETHHATMIRYVAKYAPPFLAHVTRSGIEMKSGERRSGVRR